MESKFYGVINPVQKEKQYDPDSSPKAWEHYKIVYGTDNWEEYDFNDIHYFEYIKEKQKYPCSDYCYLDEPVSEYLRLCCAKKGYSSKECNGKTYFKATLRLSGDTDFNFNEKKCKKFRSIFERDLQGKELEKALDDLNFCKNTHHTLVNFSLMQVVGNLQKVKSTGRDDGLDRLDTFVSLLNDYYSKKSELVLEKATHANKKLLKDFLDAFNGIYDYCNKVYLIEDEKFVNCIIDAGEKEIKVAKDVQGYMTLAKAFWHKKEECFKSRYKII